MSDFKSIIISMLCSLLLAVEAYAVAIPDHLHDLVPARHVTYDDKCGKTLGAFAYNELENRFYVSSYGSGRGIRCFMPGGVSEPNYPKPFQVDNVISDSSGVSWQCVTDSVLLRVAGSQDKASGTYIAASSSTIFGMVFNPVSVTVNGTNYPAGSMVVISDRTITTGSGWQKRFYSWDMREIGSPVAGFDPNNFDPNKVDPSSPFYDPDQLPDRANAMYSANISDVEMFGEQFGYGCVNWNDAFSSLLTIQDIGDVLGLSNLLPVRADGCAYGNVCFSTDGKTVYFKSQDIKDDGVSYLDRSGEVFSTGKKTFTGIWSYNLTTGVCKRLFDETACRDETIFLTEMTVIPVGLRNLTGLPYADNVDQLLFGGSDASGNLCGINCMVLDGSANPPIYPVLRGSDFLAFMEIDLNDPAYYGIVYGQPDTYPKPVNGVVYDPNNPDPAVYVKPSMWPHAWCFSHDNVGNIYFFYDNLYGVYMYDRKGRLISLNNRPQSMAYNIAIGASTDGVYNSVSQRLSVRYIDGPEGQLMPQLMYMSSGTKSVSGIDVYKPGDFDRDGLVTAADMDFFEVQLQKTRDGILPGINDPEYLNYLKADLNGNGKVVNDIGKAIKPAGRYDYELLNFSVTEKDAEILYQFVVPDFNADGCVNMLDYSVFANNYLVRQGGEISWSQGDLDFDDDVDIDDLILFVDSWLEYND